jgi:hypothetical protein
VQVGCSSNDGDGGNAAGGDRGCADIAGTWTTSGQCGPDVCVVSQSGCSTNFSCSNGAASYAGSVTNNGVSYAGTTAIGAQGSCSGTISGGTISGSCDIAGVSCTFSAKKN